MSREWINVKEERHIWSAGRNGTMSGSERETVMLMMTTMRNVNANDDRDLFLIILKNGCQLR